MLEAIVGDFLAKLGLPVANTAAAAVGDIINTALSRRAQERREILIAEIRAGNIPTDKLAEDEFIACAWKLHNAIIQGTSNSNLKFLARILTGLAKTNRPIYADKFLHYASLLEGLSHEELTLIASFAKHKKAYLADKEKAKEKEDVASPMLRVKNELTAEKGPFENGDEFLGCCASVSRTGLIIPHSGWGGMIYDTTPQLDKLLELVDQNLEDLIN